MKEIYNVFVDGIPRAQPRPRIAANGHVYDPGTAKGWKEQVKACFLRRRRQAINEPVYLHVSFFLPRPQRMKEGGPPSPHAGKPDLDNLLKSTMDAMTEAQVWKDDALVYATAADKWYARKNKTGAQIVVETGILERRETLPGSNPAQGAPGGCVPSFSYWGSIPQAPIYPNPH